MINEKKNKKLEEERDGLSSEITSKYNNLCPTLKEEYFSGWVFKR